MTGLVLKIYELFDLIFKFNTMYLALIALHCFIYIQYHCNISMFNLVKASSYYPV